MGITTGKNNLITDIAGLTVGNFHDEKIISGTTVLLSEAPNVTSVHVMGGAPGTRDTELLSPENTVESVDALVLSGGSAFGLDAASGVQAHLRAQSKGFEVMGQHVPIVPSAILFDLYNGGDKDWGRHSPYREFGESAAQNAAKTFQLGSIGAGFGALTADLRGGLGSASVVLKNGITIGALVAVNAVGSSTIDDSPIFWAAGHEHDGEYGGRGFPLPMPQNASRIKTKFHSPKNDILGQQQNTTIGIIATDAKLSKAQVKRLSVAAHDGFAQALFPSHTPLDGDLIFGLATGEKSVELGLPDWIEMSALAASTMARAIARGVYHASGTLQADENFTFPSYQTRFGK